MLRRRIIPCLDVSGGRVVKGVEFVNLRDCGEPIEAALRYAEQGADELCWLNITAGDEAWHELLEQVAGAGTRIDVPLTVGGGVSDEPHVRDLLSAGPLLQTHQRNTRHPCQAAEFAQGDRASFVASIRLGSLPGDSHAETGDL